MYLVVSIATLVTMALALVRALLGPSVYDRVLAVNMFGTKTVLLLSVIAVLRGRDRVHLYQRMTRYFMEHLQPGR